MSMKYDFTTILNREGTGAIAVSKIPFDNAEIKEGFSKIPMWVADMNYATAPSVIEAIQNRLAHPVFGYFDIKDAYSESIIEWQKTRNGVTDIPKEAIDYENGVLGGVSSVFYGLEMGQHCMINWIQHNLMFDNGTPADERLPDGVTGWIRQICNS